MDDWRHNEQTNMQKNVMAGLYEITADSKGVFLKVFRPFGDGTPVDENVIIAELVKRGCNNYNLELVIQTIAMAEGLPVAVAPPLAAETPAIEISISRDCLEASVYIAESLGNKRDLSLDEVLAKLTDAGVVFGIDQAAVQEAVDMPGNKVICARALEPVHGIDAYIKYVIDLENHGRPMELENGRVDLKSLNIFTIVSQNELIAEKIPATPGTAGCNVLGQDIPPKPGRDIPLPLGNNVWASDNLIMAAIAGQVLVSKNKISISPVLQIKGDIDFSTGNINFVGSVIVKGSVQPGFSVIAQENIEVSGTVSGGTLEGKNILIHLGIQGMNRGHIKATENVTAKFIENASVTAGRNVHVQGSILHSRIIAGKKVIVEGRKGLIAGGHIIAGEEIRAHVIGTPTSVSMELEVGISPELREEYQKLSQESKKTQATQEQAQKALAILRAMDQTTMPPDKREMMLKLTKAQFLLVGQMETMRKRIAEIEKVFEEMFHGRVAVADTIYPGARVIIGSIVKPIREITRFTNFYAEEGEIRMGSYR